MGGVGEVKVPMGGLEVIEGHQQGLTWVGGSACRGNLSSQAGLCLSRAATGSSGKAQGSCCLWVASVQLGPQPGVPGADVGQGAAVRGRAGCRLESKDSWSLSLCPSPCGSLQRIMATASSIFQISCKIVFCPVLTRNSSWEFWKT